MRFLSIFMLFLAAHMAYGHGTFRQNRGNDWDKQINSFLVADADLFARSSYAKQRLSEKFPEGRIITNWHVTEEEARSYGAIIPAGQHISDCWRYPKLQKKMRREGRDRLPNVTPVTSVRPREGFDRRGQNPDRRYFYPREHRPHKRYGQNN